MAEPAGPAGAVPDPDDAAPTIQVGGQHVAPGTRVELDLPTARLVTGERLSLPVAVVHGASPGPTVWLSAAIHGDEIGGVDIISRVLRRLDAQTMRGTVLAVPVVNVHGFITGDRYLPDRRDLNRSFPGTANGSLASQIANLFMTEIVARCELGIDLHSGSEHRTNLPQIRADLDDVRTRRLAEAFGAPVMIHARTRDGSLRHAATRTGARVLLYEAGEARRFDEHAIATGTDGVLRVCAAVGLTTEGPASPAEATLISHQTSWVRAGRSGILHLDVHRGDRVAARQLLGTIDDTFGETLVRVRAGNGGLVIGHTRNPIVNRGDAVVHVARVGPTDPESRPTG